MAGAAGPAGCGGGSEGGPDAGAPDDGGMPPDSGGDPGGEPDSGVQPGAGPLLLSEIMYHPVLEEDFQEWHEFVEIHNPSGDAVALDGWTVSGGIDFAFPDGAEIPAGGYLVVARSRDALLDLYPDVDPAAVYGDYQGELDNGSDVVLLQDAGGGVSDAMEYDDGAPWPVAADAFGVGKNWLPGALLPLEQHRYLGHSMERVSFDLPASAPANWVASALDAPTPARPNGGARAEPHVVALSHSAAPLEDDTRLVRAGDEVRVRVRMSTAGPIDTAALEYFVDDVTRSDEQRLMVDLRDDGSGGDESAGDRMYTAVLPPQAERSIVRYRVHVTAGGDTRVASPRPADPYGWHAYYVSPDIDTTTRVYELFIDPADWTVMYENIDQGRVDGCTPRPEWNDKLPAVFVHQGEVYDVRVRYQGSRYNRTTGIEVESWPGQAPAAPSPFEALSWRVQFPRYARFEDRSVAILNKLIDACPGLTAGVGMRLFAEAGIPAARTQFARFYVNGHYYRFVLDLERPGDELLERFFDELVEKGEWPADYKIGHMFKATGCNCESGPYSWGDGRLLEEETSCGYTPAERYTYTYDRKTHEWLGNEELIALIEGMHAAQDQGIDALRAYLSEQFDVERVLTYLAIINWSVPYDDMYHNYYLYQRRDDGKWMIFPWDLDRNFGDWKGERLLGPESSIYVGEVGNPDNGNDQPNYFKDALLKAFRSEFDDRLRELNQTLLHPDHVHALVDEVFAQFPLAEAEAALSPVSCYAQDADVFFKDFATRRHDHVEQLLGP